MSSSDNRPKKSGNNEVIGIILFFCAIVLALFFYLPSDITGLLGSFFKSLGFGLMGVSAHAIPVFLVYAAIDSFMEKRKSVRRLRIGTVVLLMVCVSAIFAAFSMDFEFFQALSVNDNGKTSAMKAISLLWKSGMDGVLITRPDSTMNVIPGGILGGMIATSVQAVCGRIVTCILLIGFTIAQIILIFQISVKSTAKQITNATKDKYKQYKTNRDNRGRPSTYTKDILPSDVYSKQPVNPVNTTYVPQGVNNSQTTFVNPGVVEVPIMNGNPTPVVPVAEDPFNVHPSMPVDQNTGFVDLTDISVPSMTDAGMLNYGEKQVFVNDAQNTADFSYTANPKNPKVKMPEPSKMYSFDKRPNVQKEFYDLNGETNINVPDNDIYDSSAYSEYVDDENDVPYELVGDERIRAEVRTPHVPVDLFNYDDQGVVSNPIPVNTSPIITEPVSAPTPVAAPVPQVTAPIVNEPVITEPVSAEPVINSDIRINTAQSSEGISNVEGRSIDTTTSTKSEHVEPDINTPRRTRASIVPAPTKLLSGDPAQRNANNDMELRSKAAKLESALQSFGIEAKVVDITYGPAITRFELTLKTGIKVSKVLGLADDIQLAMAATSVRIEAPIPGKSAIGIEIPNDKITAVHLRNLLETREFRDSTPLTVALGRDIPGKPILCDLAKMPHLLVAGSTGSGKSVCINSILLSILCKETPDNVRLILIDPKQVELSIYNGIPHLITPVVVDPKKATNALKWAVQEMTKRYQMLAEYKVRNLDGCNEKLAAEGKPKLPLILLVIDEFADIMTVAAKDVEEQVMRLAAMSRAAGIHMILATQRPSVDVITGVLKNNMPSRIAFAVTSGVDSRTILDSVGAEKLLGKGDMLYAPQSAPKPIRGQGAFVPDNEVESVIEFLKRFGTRYDTEVYNFINSASTENNSSSGSAPSSGSSGDSSGEDDLLDQAVNIIIEAKAASVSILQRRLGIGYPRAARLIDVMEQKHIIGPFEGSKPRKVLITKTDWLEMQSRGE